ncbi:MAG TPA: hypothetical protein PKA88_15925 [Polyangiaceae bacterium]|nr:hypothetical protein [Polyangiaceae bacterium]
MAIITEIPSGTAALVSGFLSTGLVGAADSHLSASTAVHADVQLSIADRARERFDADELQAPKKIANDGDPAVD